MKKYLVFVLAIFIVGLGIVTETQAQKGQGKGKAKSVPISDPEFEKFFTEFQAAVKAGDKSKVAGMTKFPIVEMYLTGSGGPSFSEINEPNFKESTYNYYFGDEPYKGGILKAKVNSCKKGKLDKEYFTDDSGNELGKHLAQNQETYILKIGKKTSSSYVFSKISGQWKLVVLEYSAPE